MPEKDRNNNLQRWTTKHDKAALLIAQDELPDPEICKELEIATSTLSRWKLWDRFQERVSEYRQEIMDALMEQGLLTKKNRLSRYNNSWKALLQVIEDRAKSSDFRDVPGGSTGHLIKTVTTFAGATSTKFEIDKDLLKELRELEKLAATEIGDLKDSTDELPVKTYINLDISRV